MYFPYWKPCVVPYMHLACRRRSIVLKCLHLRLTNGVCVTKTAYTHKVWSCQFCVLGFIFSSEKLGFRTLTPLVRTNVFLLWRLAMWRIPAPRQNKWALKPVRPEPQTHDLVKKECYHLLSYRPNWYHLVPTNQLRCKGVNLTCRALIKHLNKTDVNFMFIALLIE